MSQSITQKSARKRIIFSKSPPDEVSSDSTLGHMSPLSSSPDRYSSPPPSPQWLTETPPRRSHPICSDQSPFALGNIKVTTPKFNRYKHPSVVASYLKHSQSNTTPCEKNKNEKMLHEMEVVNESPLKDISQTGLMTPFKCLADKNSNVEITPKLKTKTLVIGESPDVSSVAAPVKLVNKFRLETDEPTPEAKPAQCNSDPVKLHALPASSFYSSRARTALFSEQISQPAKSFLSALNKKHKRSKSAESFLSYRCFPMIQTKSQIKRRKLGEINIGVGHRIKKPKKKMKKPIKYAACAAQPKITPADRIIAYIDKIDPSLLDKINEDLNGNVQKETADSTNNISSMTEEVPDPVECPPSPPPDPAKKFFKTKRTLKINSTATVTVDKNIKIKVSNGKFFLNKPEGKIRNCKNAKQTTSKSEQKIEVEPIGEEKSKAEAVQDTVHDDVEILLQKLVESPVKDDAAQDNKLLSPNHHISALASSTSSLVINDAPVSQPISENQQLCSNGDVQTLSTPSKEGLFEDLPDNENRENFKHEKNKKEYYPLFYKSPSSTKKLADLSNVKTYRPRGVKRPWISTGDDQYIIDAGQKKFGATQCKECGIVYEIGDPDDEITHQKFHDNSHYLKYSVMKNERVVAYYGSDKVILVKSSDSKSWLNRVKSVMTLVDEELGYSEAGVWDQDYSQVYLYVTDKHVAGCVVVHPIQKAYKMLNSLVEGCDCCSEEAYPAKCAISRIWVNDIHRRKKIATKLLDSLRSCFIQGYVIGKDEIAFSAPTVTGKAFAENYTDFMLGLHIYLEDARDSPRCTSPQQAVPYSSYPSPTMWTRGQTLGGSNCNSKRKILS